MKKYTDEQLTMFAMSDLYCAYLGIKEQYEDYLEYKKNKLESISDVKKKEMETLNLLEQLGYSIEIVGTYFYKDMILKIVEYLENIETELGFKKHHKLLDEISEHYSNFYFDLARNELDVGIKTFHKVLKSNISDIDHKEANEEVFVDVFGTKEINNLGYEEKALVIASYIYLNKKTKEKNKSKVMFK